MSTERLLRLPAVEHMTGLKRAHIYSLARDGRFPKPVKIGSRASAWPASEVERWVAEKIASGRDAA